MQLTQKLKRESKNDTRENNASPTGMVDVVLLRAGGVIRSYFYVDEQEKTVLANKLRYRTMLVDILWTELEAMELRTFIFNKTALHVTPLVKQLGY